MSKYLFFVIVTLLSLSFIRYENVSAQFIDDAERELIEAVKNLTVEKRYPEVIEKLEELIKKYPDSRFIIYAQIKIGDTYKNHLKDYKKVIASYNVLIEKFSNKLHDDNIFHAYRETAKCYEKMGNSTATLANYKKILNKLPNYSDERLDHIVLRLADLSFSTEDYTNAVLFSKRALNRAYKDPLLDKFVQQTFREKLAISYEKLEKFDEAIKIYDEVIKLFPESHKSKDYQKQRDRLLNKPEELQ